MSQKFLSKRTIIFLLAILTIVSSAQAASESVYIKVKSTRLRASPQHYASSLDTLVLGDALQPVKQHQAWYEVRSARGKLGFVHESAISERKIVLTNRGGRNSGADSSDVVLAGKGFNQEVEKQFASQNPSLNFRAVDEMERNRLSDTDLLSFVRTGGLKSDG